MAKKGQVQFQTEVNNDEEWEKLLEREGLIVVDVYSDWCGPCSGMAGNLKKLKLEVGGDILHLALAKSDEITCLERFRNKSEPTWLFISDGKMVNLMFGIDAPKLTRLIIEEIQKEKEKIAGTPRVEEHEITDLTDIEQARLDVINARIEAARLIEERKKAQELHDYRLKQAHHILETYSHLGVILILPQGRPYFQEILADLWAPAGLILNAKEKVKVQAEMIEEILFFAGDFTFPEEVQEELLTKESLALLLKPANDDVAANMTETVLELVYGEMKEYPGSEGCVAQLFVQKVEDAIKEKEEAEAAQRAEQGEEEEGPPPSEEEKKEIICIWAPLNDLSRSFALKNFFHTMTAALIIPEPGPTPPHLAVAYDSFKRKDVFNLMEQYPAAVMRYGFFTSDDPAEARLIAKNPHNFERKLAESSTFTEKMVLQLSKKRSDAFLAFAQLGPSRISNNVATGEEECKVFFPEDYDIPEEEIVDEVKKKPTKKKGKKKAAEEEEAEQAEAAAEAEAAPAEGEAAAAEGAEGDAEGGEEAAEGGEGQGEEGAEGVDKATMHEDGGENAGENVCPLAANN